MDNHSHQKPVGKSQTFPKGSHLTMNGGNSQNLNNISPTQFSQYSSSGHSSTNDLTNSLQSLQLHRNSNTSLNNLMPNNNFRNNQSTPNRSQTGPIIGYTSQNSSFNSQNSTNSITRPSMMPPLLTTATSTGNLRSQSSTISLSDKNKDAITDATNLLTPNRPKLKPMSFGKKPKGGLTFNKTTPKQVSTPTNSSSYRKTHNRGSSWHGTIIETGLKELDKLKGKINIPGIIEQKIAMSDLVEINNNSLIGKGTQGEVHKMKFICKHSKTEKTVAVKKMVKNGVQEELKRILQDNKTSHSCRTFENIAKWFGVINEENNIWIIMEFCEFGDFKNVVDKYKLKFDIKTRAIPEFVVAEFSLSVVKALHYLKQQHKIIHRDIRPSNILVDENGVVKLCDFGISGNLQDSMAFTKAAGVGTYLAPERVHASSYDTNQGYDVRSDVFALGITIFEISAGIHPFEHCNSMLEVGMEIANMNKPVKFPDTLSSQFTSDFKAFLHNTLAKKVEERWRYGQMLEHPFLQKVKILNQEGRKSTNKLKTWLYELFDKQLPGKLSVDLPRNGSVSCNNLNQTPSPVQNYISSPIFQERRSTIQPFVGTPPVPPRSQSSLEKLKKENSTLNSNNSNVISSQADWATFE